MSRTAELRLSDDMVERAGNAIGDYNTARQRWGWMLTDVQLLPAPVPFKGSQGIIFVPNELVGLEPDAEPETQGVLL